MLVASKKAPYIPVPIDPAIGTLPLIMIVHKFASVVFGILFEPVFGVLIFPPFRQIKKIGPNAIALVVPPLADIQVAFAIPVRTSPDPQTALPIPHVNFLLGPGDRHLKAAIAFKLSFKTMLRLPPRASPSPPLM